jgi:hypothetical protein
VYRSHPAAAGRSVGVAKEAHVVAVRVLDCDGAGTISNVVAGALPRISTCTAAGSVCWSGRGDVAPAASD